METKVKKTNICRWLESEFPKPLYGDERSRLKIEVRKIDSFEYVDRKKENLWAPKIGTIVDIATNMALYGYKDEIMNDVVGAMRNIEIDLFEKESIWWWDRRKNFRYSRHEYKLMLEEDFNRLGELRVEIRENGVTERAIRLINYFVKYIDYARQGYGNFWKTIEPTEDTVKNIRLMVSRTVNFLRYYEGVQGSLMFKNADMCKKINTGSIDFYTKDVVIDLKIKTSRGIWDRDIRQMITYYLLGRYNGYNFEKCIIFNPRFGEAYEFETRNIPKNLLEEIESRW